MVNILIGVTGSVATIKLPILAAKLQDLKANIKVVTTEKSLHFFTQKDLPEGLEIYGDADEWAVWKNRGDPVLHIELGKWADVFLIAPLDANSLAKMANGLCDNLLTCTARAWDLKCKPLIFCPAMNTKMYDHPLTAQQIGILVDWGYVHVPVVQKTLICGDTGMGAMAEVETIVKVVENVMKGPFSKLKKIL